jgi:RNA polymerase sigma-B factor
VHDLSGGNVPSYPSPSNTDAPVGKTAVERNPANAEERRGRNRRDELLLRRYATSRDPLLREQLIERFMPLARSLAWRYSWTSEPIDDLIQVACEGLVKAVDRYDPVRANAFSSYATPVILGTLRHYFRDGTQRVHVPRGLQEAMQKVGAELEQDEADAGHSARTAAIAQRTGLDEAQVEEAMVALATRKPGSLDAPARPDSEEPSSPMSEMLGVEEPGFERVESSLAAAGVELDEREREALRLRFGHSLNQREIGEQIGTSQMQVSRLLRRSLDKLLVAVQAEAA